MTPPDIAESQIAAAAAIRAIHRAWLAGNWMAAASAALALRRHAVAMELFSLRAAKKT